MVAVLAVVVFSHYSHVKRWSRWCEGGCNLSCSCILAPSHVLQNYSFRVNAQLYNIIAIVIQIISIYCCNTLENKRGGGGMGNELLSSSENYNEPKQQL